MTIYIETAYAKVNLALHVRGRRDDDYHEIETLFAFLNVGDTLTATAAEDILLSTSGPFADGLGNDDNNLVFRVAKLLQSHFHIVGGAALTLQKNLPVASGIGGGSADAAGTARLLRQLWQLSASDSELAELLAPLGADIPACISSVTAFGAGTGTALLPVTNKDLAGMPTLLVNPRKPVFTSAVFAAWDGEDCGALGSISPLYDAIRGRNDLELPAISICPEIGDILSALTATNAILSRMSGSGATCFALYESIDARNIAQNIMNKTWWTLAGSLR